MTANLRDIRLFVAAYEEQSFTAAAVREHATQSGVSQYINRLEERFGVDLFTRVRRRVTPTPAADAYYTKCIELLRLYEATDQSMLKYSKGVSGEIAVGMMPTMTRATLAPAMRRFIEEYPNVSVRVVEAYSPILTQGVLSGEFAFSIVPAIPARAGLKARHFLTTYETLVSRRDEQNAALHMQAIRSSDDLRGKMVLPSKLNTRRNRIDNYFSYNGIAVEAILEMDAMMGSLALVCSSEWTTVLPAIMFVPETEFLPLTIRPIVRPSLRLDLVLIEPSRHVMSQPAVAFLQFLSEEAERVNRIWAGRFEE